MQKKLPKTKEEIKKAIRDYLVDLSSKTEQVEEYTTAKLAEVVHVDVSQLEEPLSELKDEDVLDSRKVSLDIYIPKTRDGFNVLATFAKNGYVTYSPYWAIFFGFAFLFILIWGWGNYLEVPAQIESLPEAYLSGIRYGIVGSFFVGLVGGFFIQDALGRFRRWQIVSEETYKTVSSLLKHSAYIFVPLILAYYVTCNQLRYSAELSIVIALLALSVASAFGYEQIMSRKRKKVSP